MFSADSRTLKSEIDVQKSAIAPTIPRAAACRCTVRTACTIGDEERARRVARSGLSLLHEGERRGEALAQLEVALPEGSVFVVVHGERLIAATTAPEPTVGLVFYDLKSCLRDLDREPEPAAEGGE